MNFKKTSAALMAAAILAVAAPMTGLMPTTTAYAEETTGITIKTDAKFAEEETEAGTRIDTPYYGDWRNTFEITASADAFKDGSSTCYVALNYLVSYENGMNAVAEISWDCDVAISYPSEVGKSGYYYPETNLMLVSNSGGGGGANDLISVLDGDIAPFSYDYDNTGSRIKVGDKALEELLKETGGIDVPIWYQLGSNNGVDYLGAGKGVYVPPIFEGTDISSLSPDLADFYANYYYGKQVYIAFNEPGTVTITMKDRTAVTEPTTPSTPTVTTKQQSFHDDKTNITVDGKFPEGTSLKTEAKQNSDNKVSWNITPIDANGQTVQPEGNATVKLPIPETFKGKTVYVYCVEVENGKYTALESTVEGDYVVLKTDHFSEYMLTTENLADTNKPSTDNPNTGVSAAAVMGIVALAGAFAIVTRKKK